MKVAVVTESFLPHVNGVTRSVVQVLRHLGTAGHQLRVLTPGDPLTPPTTHEGVPVTGLPSVGLPGYPQVRVSLATAARITRELAAWGPDVVHLASPFVLGGPVVRAAESLGVPVVAVYQTDIPGYAAQYDVPALTGAAWRRVVSIHERAEVTLAPTATVARSLREHGVPRVQVWPRGVDTATFHPGRRERAEDDDRVRVGYVGRLAVEKRVEHLAVLADLPGVEIVVVGDGPERAALERALPTARFTGLLTGAALARETASLDVAVQTGPHETFCQAAQEAMASAVPVVAVGAGGLLDLVDSSRTGWLYEPGDLAGLRARVADLAGDRRKRRAMGEAARDAVRTRTWESVCERLVGHYEDVGALRPGRR